MFSEVNKIYFILIIYIFVCPVWNFACEIRAHGWHKNGVASLGAEVTGNYDLDMNIWD